MARILRLLALACLVNMTLVLSAMAGPRVWVAVAEEGGVYAEAAEALKLELSGTAEVSVAGWPAFSDGKVPARPDLIVTVGVAALDGVLDRLSRAGADWSRVPVLASLVPQSIYEARLAAGPVVHRPISAVILDQPSSRQMALVRCALPDRQRVGVLVGAQTRPLLRTLEKAATANGLRLVAASVPNAPENLYPALRGVLEEADIVLALPEPAIYNGGTLQNILLTTYRARVPLIAFSPAYVKAGAVLALYSTPTQVARRVAEIVRDWQAGHGLPPVQMPREFTVMVNAKVAASLGLKIDEPEAIADDLRRLEARP